MALRMGAFAKIEASLDVVKWMVGTNITLTLLILGKLFSGAAMTRADIETARRNLAEAMRDLDESRRLLGIVVQLLLRRP